MLALWGMGNFMLLTKAHHQRSTGHVFTESCTHEVCTMGEGIKNHFQICEAFVENRSAIPLYAKTHTHTHSHTRAHIMYYPKIYVKK